QDVCAQGLLQLDSWHAEALRDLASALDVEADIAPELPAASKDVAILDHGLTTGEVVLFTHSTSGATP
ncbi:MAG TPA: hypothetical protein VIV58_27700, partial [Kofleriaceae bacterium]